MSQTTKQMFAVVQQDGTKAVVNIDVFERLSDAKHLYDMYRGDYLRLYKDGAVRFKERVSLMTAPVHTPKTPRYIVEVSSAPEPWETEYRVLDTSQQNAMGSDYLEVTTFMSRELADVCCTAFNAHHEAGEEL